MEGKKGMEELGLIGKPPDYKSTPKAVELCNKGESSIISLRNAYRDDPEVGTVVRSSGQPLLPWKRNSDPHRPHATMKPEFVVSLSLHRPTDTFFLISLSVTTLPHAVAIFNRHGNQVKRVRKIERKNAGNATTAAVPETVPFVWSEIDEVVLLTVWESCRNCGYFDFDEEDVTAVDTSAAAKAEFLRLVPRKVKSCKSDESNGGKDNAEEGEGDTVEDDEEDVLDIRTIILDELFHHGRPNDDSGFRHPDPNFMLPLCKAISDELKRWRQLCRKLPTPTIWPGLPPQEGETGNKHVNKEKESGDTDVETVTRNQFHKIMYQRTKCVEQGFGICRRALGRIRALMSRDEDNGFRSEDNWYQDEDYRENGFQLGKECIGSIAALEKLQERHRRDWADYHEAIKVACKQMPWKSTEWYDALLKPWLVEDEDDRDEEGKTTASKRGKDDSNLGSYTDDEDEKYGDREDHGNDKCEKHNEEDKDVRVPDAINSARAIIEAWLEDDAALARILSSTLSMVEEGLGSRKWNGTSLKAAVDHVESVVEGLNKMEEEGQQRSILNVAKLVKQSNATCCDNEADMEERWQKFGLGQSWTKDQIEAQILFGRRAERGELFQSMSFAVDQAGLADYLQNCIEHLHSPIYTSADIDQDELFEKQWTKYVKPTLDTAFSAIKKLYGVDDLINASLLVITCCRFLCDSTIVGRITRWFTDPEDSDCGSNDIVIDRFRKEMDQLDIFAVRIALRYYDEQKRCASSLIGAGAHWLYGILRSGAMLFPTDKKKITWRGSNHKKFRQETTCCKCDHPAAAIFYCRGWNHPILGLALQGEKSAIKKWSSIEAPVVIKERFSAMKNQGMKSQAIALACMLGGDHDALHFLVSNGLANDAISQASCSGNEEGLSQLAFDLITINPCASFVCIQAHMLCITEGVEAGIPFDSICILVDLFIKGWVSDTVIDSNSTNTPSLVPSLRHLSTMAATRAFLNAADSTEKMQAILDSEKMQAILDTDYCSEHPGFILAIAAIAVITRTTSSVGLEFALHKAGVSSTSLTESSHQVFMDICCSIYECTKFLFEKEDRPTARFEMELRSAENIAVKSGCETFALQTLHQLISCDVDPFDREYGLRSPLSCLTTSFSSLFCNNLAKKCPQLMEALLDTFLRVRNQRLIKEDVRETRLWVALAYGQFKDMEVAASLLAEHVFFNGDNVNLVCITTLQQLFAIDSPQETMNNGRHSMSAFASSSSRTRANPSDREKMCSAYIYRLLSISGSTEKSLTPSAFAECVRISVAVNPSFWRLDAGQVEQRLCQPRGLALLWSDKKSLEYVLMLIFYVNRALRSGETWSTNYFVLVCGLSWLRSLLTDGAIVSFDHTHKEKLVGWRYKRFQRNWELLFDESNWRYDTGSYTSYCNNYLAYRKPVFSANAIVTALPHYALRVLNSSPHLEGVCREALGLCKVLRFLLRPAPRLFNSMVSMELPVDTDKLMNTILDSKWGTKSDFALEKEEHSGGEVTRTIPFFVERVYLALQRDKIEEAASLVCALSGQSGNVWRSLSSRSDHMELETAIARELLQGCLLTLQSAASSPCQVSEDFVNIAMHVILMMNWFQCCTKCSSVSPAVCEYAYQLVPSSGNIEALHKAAIAYAKAKDESTEVTTALKTCMGMVSCLSRCHAALDDTNNVNNSECTYCRVRSESFVFVVGNPGRSVSARDKRAERRRKRKHGSTIEDDFKELQTYLAQVWLKDASEWCNDALLRIKDKSITKSNKKRTVQTSR